MITLPGLIDPHVHFRTPGQTQKEDFTTGTQAAIAGGYTTVLDMPNNATPITTLALLKEKQQIAKQQTLCDIGFHFGSLGENFDEFAKVQDGVMGMKIYFNQTTGGFIVDDKVFAKICEAWPKHLPLLLHAEGDIIEQMIEIGHKAEQKLHICHVSSETELATIITAKQKGYEVTCGVAPHHLFLNAEEGAKIGPLGLMKPVLKPQKDIDFLWSHLKDIDLIEGDHAPHTLAEKQATPPEFGVPSLETALGLLLTAVSENKITIADITRLCHDGAAKIFNIATDAETKVEVDETATWIVENAKLFSKCKWSPFNGWKLTGKVKVVYIRGTKVFEDGTMLAQPGSGTVLKDITGK